MGFAEALRALMDERGISGRALARKVPCDQALVSRYLSGKQEPSTKMAQLFDDALGAEGALVGLAKPGRRAVLTGGLLAGALMTISPETLERLAWAERHPPQIDAAVVESLADVLAAQRRADDAVGAAALLRPTLAQLGSVENLVRQARGPVRPALVDVAQQWAQFAGWLCRDLADTAGARVCCALALEWAAEVGDRTMTATVLTERAYMAGEAGEIGAMIGLAQGAQLDATAATGQRALAAGIEARGHARVGDAAAAEHKLGEAQELAEKLTARPADRRSWSYWMNTAFFQNEAGGVCAYLAADPRWRERAVELLKTPADTGLWADATTLVHLALAHAQAGEVDEACAAVLQASRAVQRTGSARLAVVLAQVQVDLQASHPHDVRVAELADALA